MDILITGGAGYIGSHIAIELLNNKRNIIKSRLSRISGKSRLGFKTG